MADERYLAPMRRFWTDEQVETNYQAIFTANLARLNEVTVIIGKGTEGDSASAQVVIGSKDYEMWLEACEARMLEIEATAAGVTAELVSTSHVDFGQRYLST